MKSQSRAPLFLFGLSLIGLFLSLGCREDLSKAQDVDKLRVLAVKAETPTLKPGETTVIRALVVDSEDQEMTLSWEVCPFLDLEAPYAPCVEMEGMELPPIMTVFDDHIELEYRPELAVLVEGLCSRDPEEAILPPEGYSLVSCEGGFPLQVRLVARNPRGEEAIALSQVSLSTPNQEEFNQNPRIKALAPKEDALETTPGGEIKVECAIDPASVDDEGDRLRGIEINIDWYVRNGALEEGEGSYARDYVEPEEEWDNTLTLGQSGTTTVWCVARDGDGGVDWARLDFEL